MALSQEMRKLINKWESGRHWPKFLERIQIEQVRGWDGKRIDFRFPMVAIVGENGVGKSTILQAAASVYKPPAGKGYFASDFFPDTAWDSIRNAVIRYSVKEGNNSVPGSVRKPTTRWRGNPERRERTVIYIDLRRTQPIAAQVGYLRIAKPQFKESQTDPFDATRLKRFCAIAGRHYTSAGFSLSDADNKRWVPVAESSGIRYSGFHQGAGEMALADLLKTDFPNNSIILIDELETSLHLRAQRRLIRDLAETCRVKECQIIFTTHSPYVLEEIPEYGRIYVMNTTAGKQLMTGVSPHFAMTQMDEDRHPEADLYVEDSRAKIMLQEIIGSVDKAMLLRCEIIPFGAASVGMALGQMVSAGRFPRPSLVFLDGDQERTPGCLLLPGDDAPERVVFDALRAQDWPDLGLRTGRSHSEIVDALEYAMTLENHHEWLKAASDRLVIGIPILWQAMTSIWATKVLDQNSKQHITDYVDAALNKEKFVEPAVEVELPSIPQPKPPAPTLFDALDDTE